MAETQTQNNQLTPAQYANARRLLFKNELLKRSDVFHELLPKQIPFAKFVGVVVNSCINNPSLLDCTPASVISSSLKAAQLGLMPDSYTGEAHLIPFKNNSKGGVMEAQFIPGYRGLVQLAIRSGQVKRFQARAVYNGDEFDYALGTEEYIKHKPTGKSLEITHFYAVIEFTNGGLMFEVMSKAEVDQVRDASPNWKATKADNRQWTIWGKHYPEMGKKTVIRKLSKYAPISPEFQMAVTLDEQVDVIGEGQETIDIDFEDMSHEAQEQLMQELLNKDRVKKDFLKDNSKTVSNSKDRAANAAKQTEDALNSK